MPWWLAAYAVAALSLASLTQRLLRRYRSESLSP
jgi:hypothetical protein